MACRLEVEGWTCAARTRELILKAAKRLEAELQLVARLLGQLPGPAEQAASAWADGQRAGGVARVAHHARRDPGRAGAVSRGARGGGAGGAAGSRGGARRRGSGVRFEQDKQD